jgi:hypothetical protein
MSEKSFKTPLQLVFCLIYGILFGNFRVMRKFFLKSSKNFSITRCLVSISAGFWGTLGFSEKFFDFFEKNSLQVQAMSKLTMNSILSCHFVSKTVTASQPSPGGCSR